MSEVKSDIAAFDTISASDEGSVMEVKNPKTGDVLRHEDGRPFTIRFRGRDSEVVRSLIRAQSDRRIQQGIRSRIPASSASIERDEIELIVAATMEWDIILGGQPAKNSTQAYREAYTKYPWLREQGDEFIGVRSNFIKS